MDRKGIVKGPDLIHEILDHIGLKAPGDLLVLKLLRSILGITVPLDQLIVSPVILILLHDRGGIFRDQLPREFRDNLQLGLHRSALSIKGIRIQVFIQQHLAGFHQDFPRLCKIRHSLQEQALDVLLV